MIIPVKCFTCGNVLADKYRYFKSKVEESESTYRESYAMKDNFKKSNEGVVMDNMLITNPCCRLHLLTHVEIN